MARTLFLALSLGLAVSPAVAHAQAACRLLCVPQVLVEPTFTVEHLANPPRLITADGREEQAGRETVFEIILAVDIPTRLPRLGFTAEAIFIPFSKTSVNPFTGRSADDPGGAEIRDNAVELELEVNLGVIQSEQTKDWVSSHFDIVDKFSPAERPTARSAYTHKLNFEWDTAVAVFNGLPDGHWLRNIELEGSLDYVATGLPETGDEIRGERFATDASPWSLSFVVVIPLTP